MDYFKLYNLELKLTEKQIKHIDDYIEFNYNI